MAKRKSKEPGETAKAAAAAGAARNGAPATTAPFDIDELKQHLADYVCGRCEMSTTQANVGMALIKRSRGGRPSNATYEEEEPEQVTFEMEMPDE